MKAQELKQWLAQFSDDAEIVITAMSDNFTCNDFALHSPYEGEEQAQEIILPYYLNGATKEQVTGKSCCESLVWLNNYADEHGLIVTINGNTITIEDWCYVPNYAYDPEDFDSECFKTHIHEVCDNVQRAIKQINRRAMVTPAPLNDCFINMCFMVDKKDSNLKDEVTILINKWRELVSTEIKHPTLTDSINEDTVD